ncbi:acyl-CoA dehydrogenase [Streptomyces cellostaticus]|uniref:Acyl-CoA dehydrogenase n=1 Tax=Streptomyces cellostaticus TaxID=67285 RepID=A0A101N5C2_9ACTN|nr:acyl-CoA dehydrogenase family protein [Streptomyces cellostaticus]KUM86790.1 acyl-CoA dehydrogenase [Streptomyces cellostaticus]GHI10126.1 acyl-CoA dehydrogenase [Streptomyces cellostaticus]
MPEQLADEHAFVGELVGDRPDAWDRSGELPADLLHKLGARGLLCAEVPASYGGLGASSRDNGEFTAYVGSLCSSLRSIMTSQGIVAHTIQRFGDRSQRRQFLAELTSGKLAGVGFSEPAAGSDLSAMQTRIQPEGDTFVVNGEKKWLTGSRYADFLLILGLGGDGAAAALIPTDTPGLHIDLVADPMGCRAAGHANVRLDDVRIPAANVLGGGGQSLPMLFTTALSYGRMSIAWGCVGIIRACLNAAAAHAKSREQGGVLLSEHQLVRRHLAELLIAEQSSTRVCEHASQAWDSASPDMAVQAVLAKHVSAGHAARSAATAVQLLGSAGAQDGHVVARAYRDAKLMELIEGSNEICQLILAEHALSISG